VLQKSAPLTRENMIKCIDYEGVASTLSPAEKVCWGSCLLSSVWLMLECSFVDARGVILSRLMRRSEDFFRDRVRRSRWARLSWSLLCWENEWWCSRDGFVLRAKKIVLYSRLPGTVVWIWSRIWPRIGRYGGLMDFYKRFDTIHTPIDVYDRAWID
jgi:hypothetical protein